ncbi:ParA family protein [bacterium]|nr:ParA family protein [bacterium]
MGRIISIANQKGGVGKTTTAINLASSLAHAGKRTLIIDMDPQANSTTGLGFDLESIDKSTYEMLIHNMSINEAILKTMMPNMDLIPAHIRLVGAEVELVNLEDREQMFLHAVTPVRDKYEFILIDCPPSLGLLTLNALTGSDTVLIPIQCEYYALEGLRQLLNTIRLVQRHLNTALTIEGVLLTMFDSRLNLSNQVVSEVKEYFKDKVFKNVIHRNIKLGEAPSYGKPIIIYDPASVGAQDYMGLAKEVIHNVLTPHPV